MKPASTRLMRNFFVFLTAFSAGILLWWNLYAAPLPNSSVPPVILRPPNIIITDKDKMEIIASVLSRYKIMRFRRKQSYAVTPKLLHLSTNNLPAPAFDSFPQIGETEVILLLVSRADKTKPLPTYAEFNEFSVSGDTVGISLTTRFKGGNMSGRHCEFKKISGRWQIVSESFSAAAG